MRSRITRKRFDQAVRAGGVLKPAFSDRRSGWRDGTRGAAMEAGAQYDQRSSVPDRGSNKVNCVPRGPDTH